MPRVSSIAPPPTRLNLNRPICRLSFTVNYSVRLNEEERRRRKTTKDVEMTKERTEKRRVIGYQRRSMRGRLLCIFFSLERSPHAGWHVEKRNTISSNLCSRPKQFVQVLKDEVEGLCNTTYQFAYTKWKQIMDIYMRDLYQMNIDGRLCCRGPGWIGWAVHVCRWS